MGLIVCLLDVVDFFVREPGVSGGYKVVFQLGEVACADDDGGDAIGVQQPSQCHLSQRLIAPTGDFLQSGDFL